MTVRGWHYSEEPERRHQYHRGELDYLDEGTLAAAIRQRTAF
jgi:hypothetical protein